MYIDYLFVYWLLLLNKHLKTPFLPSAYKDNSMFPYMASLVDVRLDMVRNCISDGIWLDEVHCEPEGPKCLGNNSGIVYSISRVTDSSV